MSTGKHYIIEETRYGTFAVRALGAWHASRICRTKQEAEDVVKQLNPDDTPEFGRARYTKGRRDAGRIPIDGK